MGEGGGVSPEYRNVNFWRIKQSDGRIEAIVDVLKMLNTSLCGINLAH